MAERVANDDESRYQNGEGKRQHKILPSKWVAFAFRMPEGDQLQRFSFAGRRYLQQIYDSPARRKLLVCGRQVEKCVSVDAMILLENGELRPAWSIRPGDRVAALEQGAGARLVPGTISWVSQVRKRRCVRIITRQGHITVVAGTHPMRVWDDWKEAGKVEIGDRLAVVRQFGQFQGARRPAERIRMTAYMIGEGYMPERGGLSFTSSPGFELDEFLADLKTIGGSALVRSKDGTEAKAVRIHEKGPLRSWLREDGLLGSRSADKFVPDWVFRLSRRDTAMFINRLWRADGHTKADARSKYSIEYGSSSYVLVRQVQTLLWKFGIPAKIRVYTPTLYKGTGKFAYLLRVETQEGVRRFLTGILAGKRGALPLPSEEEKNNRDTLPGQIEVNIREALLCSEPHSRSLRDAGLRWTLKYPPTRGKLAQYAQFLEEEDCASGVLANLRAHLDSDLYWDEVTSVEDMGDLQCIDFQVDEHHSFITDGFVTHNSTLLGNVILTRTAVTPFFRVLYVSSSHTQTKVFSRDRISEPIFNSPVLRRMTSGKLLANVLEKQLNNGSKVTLRFAFLNADRCLVGGTQVTLADGRRTTLSDLASNGRARHTKDWTEGAWIRTINTLGAVVTARATNARSTGVREVIDVHCARSTITCTPDHRVLTKHGWVQAANLREGDLVAALGRGGRKSREAICDWTPFINIEPAGRREVFDLTVDGLESFVANGLVVHNCRGIPADLICIDEFQDILLDNIPVIEECASHSKYRLFVYSGTPKSLDGTIEYYWSRLSSQNEWVVPCRRHGTPKDPSSWHWNVLDESNIGREGLICDRCRKPISAVDEAARWAAMNPAALKDERSADGLNANGFEGYRIPQIMVPWIDWKDILHKQKVYGRSQFHNEVLGRSYDVGVRPLTRADIKENCHPELSMRAWKEVKKYNVPLFMGVDWAGGGSGSNSFTVMTLGGYLPFAPHRFTYFYAHQYTGVESDPEVQIEHIVRAVRFFDVQFVGVDYGGGHWPNDRLVREFGTERVKKYQWVGNVKKKIKYEPQLGIPRFLCHRTEIMSDFFNGIKRRDVFHFPRWEEFDDPYAKDFLNIFSEYNERLRMNVYSHAPGMPDDTAHSAIFCFLASFFYRKRADVILPAKELDREFDLDREIYDELDVV